MWTSSHWIETPKIAHQAVWMGRKTSKSWRNSFIAAVSWI